MEQGAVDGGYRRAVFGLAIAGLVAFGELYGVQSLLPAIAEDLRVSAADAALAQSGAALGVAVAVVPWSLLARRIGTGRALRLAVALTAILGPLVPLMESLELIVAVRVVQGMVIAGIPGLALVHLGRILDARHALAAAGWYIAGTSVGGPLGRLVAGVGGIAGWRVGLAAVSLMTIVAAIAFFALRSGTELVLPVPTTHVVPGDSPGIWRDYRLWALYLCAFLYVGAFVALYNYLGFRLVGPVFGLPDVVISFVYLAYVFGTVSSAAVGRFALTWGRRPVLVVCVAAQLAGTALTLSDSLPLTAGGVAIATAGFFGAHTIGSGWAAQLGRGGTGASAGYSLAFYLAAGVLGWVAGLVYVASGWTATVSVLCAALLATLLAGFALPKPVRRA